MIRAKIFNCSLKISFCYYLCQIKIKDINECSNFIKIAATLVSFI